MKLNQTKMIRLGAVVAGVAVLYVLFTSYSGAKGAVLDRAEELGGSGSMAPSSNGGPYMSMPHGVAGNATSVSGMIQGRTPSSQQTYQESTLSSSELLPNGKIGADWEAVNPVVVGRREPGKWRGPQGTELLAIRLPQQHQHCWNQPDQA